MADTTTYETLRAQLDEEQWALSDAFRAAKEPEERERIMAALKGSIREGIDFDAAHRGIHTRSDSPRVLRVFLAALEREHDEARAELRRTNGLIARVALAVGDPTRDLPPLPPSLWRGLHDHRDAVNEAIEINAESQTLVRDLLAVAE